MSRATNIFKTELAQNAGISKYTPLNALDKSKQYCIVLVISEKKKLRKVSVYYT